VRTTIQVEDISKDEDMWVYVTCPNCRECEGMPVDEQRHHLQGFTFVDQGYTATDDDITKMLCNTCDIPFDLTWDYDNIVTERGTIVPKAAKPTYEATGVTRRGHRFKVTTDNYVHAMGINLWRGTVWEVANGKRKKIRTVYN
tara:strand:- start:1629 stop:2057 length:429 start_codon:yes stop_codon:yes gene_type:complete